MNVFGVPSFLSIWYWVLHIVVWTLVTQRTLGVPYDMLLRARRLDEVARRVETLALIQSERLTGLYHALGLPAALFGGFLLSALFAIGFIDGVELAQAAFLIVFPVSVVACSTLSIALRICRRGYRGDMLVMILARRHFWHQVVAVAALLGAMCVAFARHQQVVIP